MSYAAGEAAILTRIQAHANYSTANSARNDWKLLDGGNSGYYAFVRPGADVNPTEFITPLQYVIQWSTAIECWRQYIDEGTTATALFGDVNTIITQMQPYRTLGLSYVQVARVTGVSTPAFRWAQDGGPAWLVQEVIITWLEEVTLSAYA